MSPYTDFLGPDELRTRGSVLVVPGRGETRATYARFGTRLAVDAYRVRVVDPPRIDPDDTAGSLAQFSARLTAAVADLTDRPLVLVGADSGAAAVLARGDVVSPDALVLAGLPGFGAGVTGSWDDELDVRTACVVHRGVLSAGPAARGTLSAPLPDELLAAAYKSAVDATQLVLVGDEDPLADLEGLARLTKTAPRARLSIVHGARHDVLNDRQHRSVAAEVVSFLETLGNNLVPVISVESSAW